MGNSFTPEGFWTFLIVFLLIAFFFISIVPMFFGHLIGADKKKLFSANYINDFHKKGNKTIPILSLIILFPLLLIFIDKPLIIYIISISFLIIQVIFEVYVEWKFSKNRANYKVTLLQLSLLVLFLTGSIIWFNSLV